MQKLYTLFFVMFLVLSKSYSVEYSLFTAAEGTQFLEQNFNLKGWELFQANTIWYPNDSTVIFDFVNGKSSYWYYTYRKSIENNNPQSWTFLLTKVNDQFNPLDLGIEDDDFLVDFVRLPKKWIDSDMLPTAVQANSNLGIYLMENLDKVVEFNVLLTPRYVTEVTYPDGMWWLSLELDGQKDLAYCIFDASTLEKVECFVPEMNSISEDLGNKLIFYPNPANDFIEIQLPMLIDNRKVFEIKIYNSSGNCVVNHAPNNSSNTERLDISELPAGTYYLKYGHLVKKFLIIH